MLYNVGEEVRASVILRYKGEEWDQEIAFLALYNVVSYTYVRVSRVAQLVAQRIVYHLRPNAVCTIPVQAQTLLCGSPAQERCWPTTCAHLIGHEIRGTIIQLCRKEPTIWQVMSGTIIQLCRKKSLPLGRSPIIIIKKMNLRRF